MMQQKSTFNTTQNQCVASIEELFKQYSQLNMHATSNEMQKLKSLIAEELQELHEELIDLKVVASNISSQVNEIKDFELRNFNLLQQIILGSYTLPSLFTIEKDENRKRTMWFRTPMKLNFYCPITNFQSYSYEIKITKKWVKKIVPILQVSIVLLKIAASVYGIPLPIPTNFIDYVSENNLQACFDSIETEVPQKIFDKIDGELKNIVEKNKCFKEISEMLKPAISSITKETFFKLQKVVYRSEVQDEHGVPPTTWEPSKTGLCKTTSLKDGTVAWIKNDKNTIDLFHKEGKNSFIIKYI
jgi:hypothetical protein